MARFNKLYVGEVVFDKLTKNPVAAANPQLSSATNPPAKVYTSIIGPTLSMIAVDNEVQKMIDIPAGMFVSGVTHQVAVAATKAAHSAEMGDATDTDGWDTALDLKQAANTKVVGDGAYATAAALSIGKSYPLGGQVNVKHLTITGAAETGGTHRIIVFGYL